MRAIRRLRGEEDGTLLVFVAISVAVLLGMVALSFDLGRMASTQTELQSFADNVALAAAGELDGKADSITRARRAASNLVTDRQTFGSGGRPLDDGDFTLTFMSELDATDLEPPYDDTETTDPLRAAFVQVDVDEHEVSLTFAGAFSMLTGEAEPDSGVSASAVAGFTRDACDITPIMFCLPDDWAGADAERGRMIRLRGGGNGAAWGPGDFGFLDPTALWDGEGPCKGLNGAQLESCLIGAVDTRARCVAAERVDTNPGQRAGIEDSAFNVRFDLYQTIMNGERNDPDYAPAPNVIKGTKPQGGGSCIGNNADQSTNSMGLPHEAEFANPAIRFSTDRLFNGTEREEYVNMNYGDSDEVLNEPGIDIDPHPTARTRYEYYLAEIAAQPLASPILIGREETGRPQCFSGGPPAGADRRVMVAAGVDCVANEINGRERGVPVEEFIEFFLTEPVNDGDVNPPRFDIFGEVIGAARRNSSAGILRDLVQLYR